MLAEVSIGPPELSCGSAAATSGPPECVWALIRNSTSDSANHATTASTIPTNHPLGGDPPAGPALRPALVLPVPDRALERVVFAAQTGSQALGAGAVELVRGLFEIAWHVYAYSDGMPGRRTIGVDMGGSKLLAGAVDSGLSVHHRAQRSINRLDVSYLLDVVVDAVEETVAGAGGEVAAVGFGIPSLIDQRTGNAVIAVNLPLKNIMFADVMAERLDLPVFVDNDANCAMLAEHRAGAARGCNEAVLLTIGTGIGGGLLIRGELYRGAIGAAAELGHVVIDRNGPPCQGNCPNHGCVESLASGTALAREALRMAHERPDSGLGRAHAEGRELVGPLVTELAHDGDAAAIETIATIGRNLGVAIAGFVNTFNPEVVVIGGGVMGAGELLLGPVRAEVAARALPPSRDLVEIVPAAFGVEAGMIGASTLAFDGLRQRAEAGS